MGFRSWIRRFGLAALLASLVITLVLGVAVAGILALLVLPMLAEAPTRLSPQLVNTLVPFLIPLAGALIVFIPLTVLLFVGVLWSYARHLELSAQLYMLLARLERSNEFIADLHPTTLLDARFSPEERETRKINHLKDRYVEGELTMDEFEREVERVYHETPSSSGDRVELERDRR